MMTKRSELPSVSLLPDASRRGFLKSLGLAAAAAGWPALAAAPAWRPRLATSSIQFMSLSLEETCRRIAALGFEAIDIWDEFTGCKHLEEAARLGGAGLRDLLERHKLKLSAITVYRTSYDRYAKLLDEAGGGIAVRSSEFGVVKPEDVTPRMKKFFETLKPLIALAEQHNGRLAIENHGDALLSTPDSFKAFMELNPSPRVGIALAPYHLQSIQASVPDVIRTCGKQLLFFYAWQNAGGIKQLPGSGPADFRPWMEALADIGYDRHVHPFMHGHPAIEELEAALAKSRAYLQELNPAETTPRQDKP